VAEGLEFLLELDAKLNGLPDALKLLDQAQAALKKTDQSTRAVDVEMEKLNATLKKLERPHKIEEMKKKIAELEKPIEKAEGAFQRMIHQGMEPFLHRAKQIAEFEFIRRGVDWLIEMPFKMAEGVEELGKKILEAGAHAERSRKSFAMLFGKEEGHEMKDWAERIYKKTEFTKSRNIENMGELGKAGFKGKELEQAHLAALDMAALSGNKEEGLAGASNALEMIRMRGEVNFRALKQVGISDQEYKATLASRLGMTKGQKGYIDENGSVHKPYEALQKKIDAGQIDPQELTKALYAAIMKRTGKPFLGGAGLEMGGNLESKMEHIDELPALYIKKMSQSKGFEGITTFADRIMEKFDPNTAGGQKVIAHMIEMIDKIGQKLEKIDVDRLVVVLDKLVGALERLLGVQPEPKTIGDTIRRGLSPGHIAGRAGSWLINKIVGDDSDQSAASTVDQMGDTGANAGEAFSEKLHKAMTFGGANAGAAATGGVKDKLQIHSPSRVFEQLGEMTGEGFNRGLDKSMGLGDDVARGAFALPAPKSMPAGGPIHVETNITVNGVSGDANQIAEMVSAQVGKIMPGSIIDALAQAAAQAGSGGG